MSVDQKAKWDANHKIAENDSEVKVFITSSDLNADAVE